MDQFAYWKAALEAKQNHLEIPREKYHDGKPMAPECGYYRRRTSRNGKPCWEAVAFYPTTEGVICERQFGDVPVGLNEQVALFASVWDQPVPFDVFEAVVDHGAAWPDDLDAFGLPPVDAPDNPAAVMGHNEPPEKTAVDRARERFALAKQTVSAWVKQFPNIRVLDATQGDLLSRYGVKFRELKQEVEKVRKDEVEPHVRAQREINAKWKPLIDEIEAEQRRVLGLWGEWRDEAERKAAEAARKANEEAQRIADQERERRAEIDGDRAEPPPPVQLIQPAKIKGAVGTRVSSRSRTIVTITDLALLLEHIGKMENPPQDVVDAVQTFANRYGPSGTLPGVRVEKQPYVA